MSTTRFGIEMQAEATVNEALDRTCTRKVLLRLKDYIQNASVEVMLTLLGFVSSVLIARNLGPDGRGKLAAAVLWPTWICLIISLGLPHAFAYATSVGWESPHRLRKLAARYALAVGFPAMIAYWALSPYIMRRQFHGTQWVPGLFSPF